VPDRGFECVGTTYTSRGRKPFSSRRSSASTSKEAVVGRCFARCAGDADDAESVIGEDVGGEEIRRRLHDDDVAGFRQRRARDVQPVARAGD
jgi:hypothetical protein